MEAAWSITDLPPAAPGILLLLLLVELGLLGSSSFAIFNNLNTFDYEIASNRWGCAILQLEIFGI